MISDAAGGADIRAVALDDVLAIRRRVLRPHQRLEDVEFDGDRRRGALHVGAFVGDRLVGSASIVPDPEPGTADDGRAWRVRGMAVDEDVRGRGIGAALLDRCIEHARRRGGTIVWCNARVRAVPFYERRGFVAQGEAFDVDVIGPHLRMRRTL